MCYCLRNYVCVFVFIYLVFIHNFFNHSCTTTTNNHFTVFVLSGNLKTHM